MVAQPGIFRPTFNAGEFGEAMDPRYDVREYYSACRRMKNAEPLPQSGARLLPGSNVVGSVRRQMTEVSGSVSTATAVGGGVDVTIWQSDFDELAVSAVSFVDIVPNSAFQVGDTIAIETRKDAVWTVFGSVFVPSTDQNQRSVVLEPGAFAECDGVRIVLTMAAPGVTIPEVSATIWTESSELSTVIKFFEYTVSGSETYCLCITPGFADLWLDGSFESAFPIAVAAEIVARLNIYQEAKTIGFFHQDLKSLRAVRLNSGNWRTDDWPYKDIGITDYGQNPDGTPYAKTDDIWSVFLRWVTATDDISLNFIVNGEETGAVSLGENPNSATDWAGFATNIQAALEALPSLNSGIVVTEQSNGTGARELTITFGGENSGHEYEVAAQITNTSSASALSSHTQVGKIDGEPIISTDRGWPAQVGLAQDRIVYGGLKSRPMGMLFSETGEYFNVNTDQIADDSPMARAIRSTVSDTIRHIIYKDHLVVLTDDAEHFANDRVISRNTPLNFINSSENGSSPTFSPRYIEGVLYYSDPGGDVLYRALYDDVGTKYESDPVSDFAPHLFSGVVEGSVIRPSSRLSAHKLLCRRDDGRLIQIVFRKSQNIVAFSEWETEGEIMALTTDRSGKVYLAVKRNYATGPEINVEVWDKDQWMHGVINLGSTDLAGILTIPPRFEGRKVWVVADGYSLGEYTVSNNQIDLEFAYTSVDIGFWTAPWVEPMPFLKITQNDEIVRRPGRVHTVRLSLDETTSIAIAANGEEPREIILHRAGDTVDAPLEPVTRHEEISGLQGIIVDTTVAVTQLRPGKLEFRDLVVEAAL
ncbi:MAG: hypothetical protein AAF478_03490 [Pseudomonadota bacterium]